MLLFTDRCCDIQDEKLKELGVLAFGLSYHIGPKEYLEGPDTDLAYFYDQIRQKAITSTSQTNASDIVEFFTPYLDKGEDILYLAFSSGLSGTYQSAVIATGELKKKYPDRKIVAVDTLCASLGQGLLITLTAKKIKDGLSFEELVDFAEGTKMKVNHWVTVNDLHYLRRGGRLSGTAALMGTILDIKPIIIVNDEGKLISIDKKKGRRKALNYLLEKFYTSATDKSIAFISHSDCLEDAEYVAEELKKIYPDIEIYINYIGTVIGSHTGIGTVALFFIGGEREQKQ